MHNGRDGHRMTIETRGVTLRATFSRIGRSRMLILEDEAVVALPTNGRGRSTAKEEVVLGEGAVAVPRRVDGPRTYIFYQHGVFEAFRGCLHTREKYGVGRDDGEVAVVRLTIRATAEVLRMLWAWGRLTRAQQRKLDDLTARLAATSERWMNIFKRIAADRFEASLYTVDALGRRNPGATAARYLAADRHLRLRLEEIAAIVPCIGYREMVLLVEIDRIYGLLETAWSGLQGIAVRCGRTPVSSQDRVIIARSIRAHAEELASVRVEPFITNLGEASRELLSAARHLVRGRERHAQELVLRAREALRYKFAQYQIEELLRIFSIALAGRGLTPGEMAVVTRRVSEFRVRLGKLRMPGLRHDPYEEVRAHADEAARLFAAQDLPAAKDALKAASHAM